MIEGMIINFKVAQFGGIHFPYHSLIRLLQSAAWHEPGHGEAADLCPSQGNRSCQSEGSGAALFGRSVKNTKADNDHMWKVISRL